MILLDDAKDNYDQVQQSDNKAELSHELLAGGASFMAFKAFEDHQRKEGAFTHRLTQASLSPITC